MDIRPSGVTPELLRQYSSLFRRCFPTVSHLDETYLDWLYRRNPAGSVVGFDAWEGTRLAAHYVCVPADAKVAGRDARVLLSLNTATDPEFQGRGLFTQLAEATYAAGAAQALQAVYGVANANSTPGFVRKLGFTLVRPLDARIGIGRVQSQSWNDTHAAAVFRRDWTPATLAWRIANPARPYRLVRLGANTVAAAAPTGRPGLWSWAELAAASAQGLQTAAAPWALRLHLGLMPGGAGRRRGAWIDIPQRLRPSPLNLIFRSLAPGIAAPPADAIAFGQLDFDAY